jgi:S-adenosyl-L-methionine hydrolase (adenosine-forming)
LVRGKTSRATRSILNNMSNRIITLTTDFGLRDPYVAEMKGIILKVHPNAKLIDITHEIEKFNIRMGAYIFCCAAEHFPEGTIHVVVVDPTVGTKRRPILVETKKGFFIGPDNGVLSLAAVKAGILNCYEITNPHFMLPKVSNTFHGRDIFAPAAAYLANGVDVKEFGRQINEITKPRFTKVISREGELLGEILHLDGFGNVITNIAAAQIERLGMSSYLQIKTSGQEIRVKLCQTYGEAKLGDPLALIGSHGYLEIAVNQGSAFGRFRTKLGDKITVTRT